MNNKAQVDFIDIEVFYQPAYWMLVALAVVGLAIGFGGAGMMSTEQAYIPWIVKVILFVSIFPVAYLIFKVVSR